MDILKVSLTKEEITSILDACKVTEDSMTLDNFKLNKEDKFTFDLKVSLFEVEEDSYFDDDGSKVFSFAYTGYELDNFGMFDEYGDEIETNEDDVYTAIKRFVGDL